jgi:WD40 repeat protein
MPKTAEIVSADGRRAVSCSGSWEHSLKVWDLASGRLLQTLAGHTGSVSDFALTPDGRRAVTASWDKTLKVWDIESGAPIATFFCDAPASCCAFATESTIVAGDRRGRVYILTLEE